MKIHLKYFLTVVCAYIVGAATAQNLKADLTSIYAAYSKAACVTMSGKIQTFDLSAATPKLEVSHKFDYVKYKNDFWYSISSFVTILQDNIFVVIDKTDKRISVGEAPSNKVNQAPIDVSQVDSFIRKSTNIVFIGESQNIKRYQIDLPKTSVYYRVDLELNMSDNTIKSITQFQKNDILESHIKVVLDFNKVSFDDVTAPPQVLSDIVTKSNKNWALTAKYKDYQLIAQTPKK